MALAKTSAFSDSAVTRAEYLEGGSDYCRRKFGTDLEEQAGNDERGPTPPPSARMKVRTRTVSGVKRR